MMTIDEVVRRLNRLKGRHIRDIFQTHRLRLGCMVVQDHFDPSIYLKRSRFTSEESRYILQAEKEIEYHEEANRRFMPDRSRFINLFGMILDDCYRGGKHRIRYEHCRAVYQELLNLENPIRGGMFIAAKNAATLTADTDRYKDQVEGLRQLYFSYVRGAKVPK